MPGTAFIGYVPDLPKRYVARTGIFDAVCHDVVSYGTVSLVEGSTDIGGSFSGHHTERVVLWMPSGAAYQALNVAFAADVPAAAGEQQAQPTSTGWRVWTSIPVAGTTIEEFSITGRWSAGVYVDSSTAANASMTFTLQ